VRNNVAVIRLLLEQPQINLIAKDDEGDRAIDLTKSTEIRDLISAKLKEHRPADFY
jgi:ABC-type Na+ transport system ATPase subunit NatA